MNNPGTTQNLNIDYTRLAAEIIRKKISGSSNIIGGAQPVINNMVDHNNTVQYAGVGNIITKLARDESLDSALTYDEIFKQ